MDNGAEMRLVSRAKGGGVTVVVGYQARATPAVEVGVPGPGQVAGGLRVHPGRQAVDVRTGAVVLADLSGYERDLGDRRSEHLVPASLRAAGVEVVGVPRRGQVVRRVGRLVGQPPGQVV